MTGYQFEDDRRVLYATVAGLVLVACAGVLYAVVNLGGMRPSTVGVDAEITENSTSGEVTVTVRSIENRVEGLNITTEHGGGTGELLTGVSEGDAVTLEAVDEPDWRENGTGTYDADGDEIQVVAVLNDTRVIVVSHETDTVGDDPDNATQNTDDRNDGLRRGDVEVVNESFYVESPYGGEPAKPMQVINDGDGTVGGTVEVFEGDDRLYAAELRMASASTYTDAFEIGREGEYEVRVNTDSDKATGTWRVREGYPRLVVLLDQPKVVSVATRGYVEVTAHGSAPDDAQTVPSNELAKYEPVYGIVVEYHRCRLETDDEDCEGGGEVAGDDWVNATDAVDELPLYNGEGGLSGVYVEHEGEIYSFGITTQLSG